MSSDTPTIEKTGLGVTHYTWSDAKSTILGALELCTPSQVITLTPEMCVRAESDSDFSEIISRASIVVADGVGVAWGESKLSGRSVEKIPGIDLASWAIGAIEKIGGRLFLLGAKPDVIEKTAAAIERDYPGIASIGLRDGYFVPEEEDQVVSEIANANPHLLLVGMGSPKQEFFISKYLSRLNCCIAIGVGGSFDVWSGTVKRAPEFYRKTGTEWLYRTVTQPSTRIGRIPKLWKFTGIVFKKARRT